ncbi:MULTISPECIES: helix-turn-helix domain-containing protein [Pseudomonas]|jgi:hypothetical protein|uniref:helix-turn-helix domain-containing protein n=1 Tax=Pseudomonas TaxID=286 RepID=UPI0008E7D591|nr:Helix-turn-helix domain-containing protein [Pseudomonas marincola]
MGKNKADQQASSKNSHLNNTSVHAQRARLLERFHQVGSVTTIAARNDLNIMMPAARVKELRELGHPIKTHRITMTDEQGRTHQGVALYYIGALPADSEVRA